MNGDIGCEICRDLLPLVEDGVASEESRAAVQAHLQSCPACRALAGQAAPPPPVPDGAALLRRVRRGTRGFALVVLLAGALFGMGLSGSMDMFYNSLLMPAMGAAAWFVWRWKAAAVLPPLLAGMSLVCWGLRWGWGMETGPLPGYLIWAAIYCVLALVGVAIAGLFHFALKKEGDAMKRRILKLAAFAAALALLAGVLCFSNALLGNPVSKFLASRSARAYLAGRYPDADYRVDEVTYNFKTGGYAAAIVSPTSIDSHFTLGLSMTGQVLWDGFHSVESGWNTWLRLDGEYRALVDTVLDDPDFPYNVHIGYGSLWMEQEYGEPWPPYLLYSDLELDGDYDVRRLGVACGRLTLYVRQDEVSAGEAAQILLETRRAMDEANIPFYCIDFVLEHPLTEDGRLPEGDVQLRYFPYGDIREEGLVERVRAADAEAKAYYAALDAQSAKGG